MTFLNVKNITKIIKNKKIIDNISFSVRKGEVIGIIGPNGSGKSSLFKIISKLWKADKGEVTLNGDNILSDSIKINNKIGFLIESPPIYTYLTVEENLRLFLRLHKIKICNQIEDIALDLGLEDILEKKGKELSMGMKQKLGIAFAVIHDPEIIILDEPTNCLDIKSIRNIRQFIKKLKSKDKTVILSSHMLTEIKEVCDKLIILKEGKIIEEIQNPKSVNLEECKYTIYINSKGQKIESSKIFKFTCNRNNSGVIVTTQKYLQETLEYLINNKISIISIKEYNETLEDYFIKKVGESDDRNNKNRNV